MEERLVRALPLSGLLEPGLQPKLDRHALSAQLAEHLIRAVEAEGTPSLHTIHELIASGARAR